MRMLDLFSGIGGFAYAAQSVWGDDLDIVAFCEIDPYCQKVLKKHWPDVPIVEDIKDVTKETLADTSETKRDGHLAEPETWGQGSPNSCVRIDLLTGGFPCQPASVAGKRKGKADDRWLWPEMFRVIRDLKPTWVIAENVRGLLTLESGLVFEHCCADLEGEGYKVQPFNIPACAVGADHRRERVWIVAHRNGAGQHTDPGTGKGDKGFKPGNDTWRSCSDVADTEATGSRGQIAEGELREYDGFIAECASIWPAEPDVGRVAHGVPARVDRLKSLGNAIVPQVAMMIMRGIKETEKEINDLAG